MDTMYVKTKPCPGNPEGIVWINCCDFDPAIHRRMDEPDPQTTNQNSPDPNQQDPGASGSIAPATNAEGAGAEDDGKPKDEGKPQEDGKSSESGNGPKESKGKRNGKPKDEGKH